MPTLNSIKNIRYFTKGRRGILLTGYYKSKKVVIKQERKDSGAIDRIKNEVLYLQILNKEGIGPKLLFFDRNFSYFIIEFIDGDFFPAFLEKGKGKTLTKKIISDIYQQCYKMDTMLIDKEEMQHPYKHIIIKKKTKRPVLIDFERCHKVLEPKNVTQFSSYIISEYIINSLKEKGININKQNIINAAKRYKKDINKNNLNKIIREIA